MDNTTQVVLDELLPMSELQQKLAYIFPSQGSLDWEIRVNRRQYIEAGAIFEIRGRLMAHPETFKRTALAIGLKKVAVRAGVQPPG